MGTENVKLGVCNATFGGANLGLTKGGVNVEVTTDKHVTTVDQFGDSEINERITKRSVKITVPLAETTLENLVKIMPGATMTDNGNAQIYTVSMGVVVDDTDYTVSVENTPYTFNSGTGSTASTIASRLADRINIDSNGAFNAVASGADVVMTARVSGVSYTVSQSGSGLTGVETTAAVTGTKRVDVTNAVGTDLLGLAQTLVLHPQDLSVDDKTLDFTVYKASTGGALTFSYSTDEERIYNVEFTGYPDGSNGNRLFSVGDSNA